MQNIEKNNPLVSVLIPAYNAEKYIEPCLRAVMSQTYQNLEILVINDGSQDKTAAILEELAAADARLKIVHNSENLKLIATLNKGLQLAKGEFIARTDADDISRPDWIKTLLTFLLENPDIQAVGAGINMFKNDPHSDGRTHFYPLHHNDIIQEMMYSNPFAHPVMLIRSGLFHQNGLRYNCQYPHAEDYKLWLEISKIGKLANVPKILLDYRLHDNNVSLVYKQEQLATTQKIRKEAIAYYLNQHQIAFVWPEKLHFADLPKFTAAVQTANAANMKFWNKLFENMALSLSEYRWTDLPRLIKLASLYHFRYSQYRRLIRKFLNPNKYNSPF